MALCAALLSLLPNWAWSSERSERLVAKGELAYHRGQRDEAGALFAEAAAADPDDAAARRWLEILATGEVGAAVPIEGPTTTGSGARRWSVYAATGFQYDSNVTIAPGGATGESFGDRDDVAFIFSGGARYDLVDRADALVRLEYDLYQTLHPDLDDFDFRSNRVRATASHRLLRSLWGGVQGGYDHYTLGPHSYLGEAFVLPFLSFLEGQWGLTQLLYRYGDDTYFSTPFNGVRDGPSNSGGLTQTLYGAGGAYATAGLQGGTEQPRSDAGDDYRLAFYQVQAGVGLPAWWQTTLDVMYVYRYDNYTERNSVVDFRKQRHDSTHNVYATISRPVGEHLSVALAYYGTVDFSNIAVFEYHRNVVSAVVQVSY